MTQAELPGVSRETNERLAAFQALLLKWTPAINLISSGDVAEFWTRHIVDSAQLSTMAIDPGPHWLDLGSGGGLPGLVLAVLHKDSRPTARHTLVESDGRKAAFLMTAAHRLDLDVTVHARRAEALEPQRADVITARAVAPLTRLLRTVHRHLATDGQALLPKGRDAQSEVDAAAPHWQFTHKMLPSATNPEAAILYLTGLSHA